MSIERGQYSLSVQEFGIPTEVNAKVFRPGDTVTRGNFVQFIIWSFAISRGTPQGQASAMEWVRQHEDFDYLQSGENFNLAGGIACLSEEEKQTLLTSIKGVRKHEEEDILEWEDHKLLEKIGSEFSGALQHGVGSMLVHPKEMKDQSWDAFFELLNERIDYKLKYDKEKKESGFW